MTSIVLMYSNFAFYSILFPFDLMKKEKFPSESSKYIKLSEGCTMLKHAYCCVLGTLFLKSLYYGKYCPFCESFLYSDLVI